MASSYMSRIDELEDMVYKLSSLCHSMAGVLNDVNENLATMNENIRFQFNYDLSKFDISQVERCSDGTYTNALYHVSG